MTMTLSSDLSLTETTEGAFVLDKRSGQCFALNPLGLHVWQCLQTGMPHDQIVKSIASQYRNVPAARISEDCQTFLTRLRERQLITP